MYLNIEALYTHVKDMKQNYNFIVNVYKICNCTYSINCDKH